MVKDVNLAVLRLVNERVGALARVDFRMVFERLEIDDARFRFLAVGRKPAT